jgi:hypothetical protein
VSYSASGAGRPSLALRWVTLTATGMALDHPGRLYYVRLSGPAAATAVLRDSADATGLVLLGMAVSAAGAGADDWPRIPVTIPFLKGLHATLTGAGTLSLGWEKD